MEKHRHCTFALVAFLYVLGAHAEPVVCPGGKSACPAGTTCCELPTGGFGCCPAPEAVCCADHTHCCPAGSKCDPSMSKCVLGSGLEEDAMIKTAAFSFAPSDDDFVECPDKSKCPALTTCCEIGTPGKYGCCPSPEAVCCPDHQHCCPKGTKCDEKSTGCSAAWAPSYLSVLALFHRNLVTPAQLLVSHAEDRL
mmetsp:Transcript_52146/g.86705  ORF Transcript_52146/g.86705 Transcript_52146/m.86705 type:complete len:195 (+) Transcript_52146:54-638(+)|eukprot:CAMPEP_0184351768 /NCGR_PEP_ID=MMETSP1089-20130417/52206_1 /TAXON_ID=38269 ORGANISM="Gloeochaete wittrockiana, Strain SAG46.84" /NCGR_SAMPLE_ID=MMETSP1089 /ASSEMBLY_ACC=CAM_ASM_000445 /LENGTH=194 /DNA_ID=CAMNT_0026685453 /DNA_START=33 /DNA_END=617 /DNA_ORIENTATION=-